jgi:hypothetical protein
VRYIYVDETGGAMHPGGRGVTWAFIKTKDPWKLGDLVRGEWVSKGSPVLTDLRKLILAGGDLVSDRERRDELRALAEFIRTNASPNQLHTRFIRDLFDCLGVWRDQVSSIRALPELGAALASIDPTSRGLPRLDPVAAFARTGIVHSRLAASTMALRDAYDRSTLFDRSQFNSDDDFIAARLTAAISTYVRQVMGDCLTVVASASEDRLTISVRPEAAGGISREQVAPIVFAYATDRLLGPNETATLCIDGSFKTGMALKRAINRHRGRRTVTGIVPLSSLGCAPLWAADLTAFYSARTLGWEQWDCTACGRRHAEPPENSHAEPTPDRLLSDLVAQHTTRELIDTPDGWSTLVRGGGGLGFASLLP